MGWDMNCDSIIEAMERCVKEKCENCPYTLLRGRCTAHLMRNALEVLRCQKDEIASISDLYVDALESIRLASEACKDMSASPPVLHIVVEGGQVNFSGGTIRLLKEGGVLEGNGTD